ncbi:MAG: UDP-N-acetylmuramoyl-tripeptide--D-alanyl-D-alanine ligase [Bacteroidales bacterium]|jgi:UDP-N-acetylmuramoyl-tripeptide--D-alanyl-D-alanine ligase|nr:UDP-N-acetylmuramoyl-tripeptide--D-alanyl-D-alanine ligase [Bacteroidales bacterium]
MEIKALYDIFLQSAGVCTDTRTLKKNQLFFALKGENFDGNRFALQALEKGASYAVAGEDLQADDPRLIKVPDTLEALKALAAYHRRQLRIPVIGLTGTNGKTTTKELIKTALGAAYRVSATEGNLNNEIGVPLTVLKIGPRAQIAIVEMGASHPEDLKPLLAVAQPNLGLITNVGKAHLEGFGSYEGVKHAKGLLYDYLKEHDGVVFANADDPVLQEMLAQRGLEAIGYSKEGVKVKADPFLKMEWEDATLQTQLVGAYNAANVLAALKLAWYFDVPREDALQAIASYVPSNNRSQLVKTQKNTLIVDAYNANPSSMAVALDNLALMKGRKVALLGDMRELGADAAAEHDRIVARLEGMEAYLVGEEFTRAAAGKPYKTFAKSEDLAKYLAEHPLEGCTVLLKGSHSIQMEKVIKIL